MEKNKKLEKVGRVALGVGMIAGEFAICFFNGFGIGRILKEKHVGLAGKTAAAIFVGGVVPTLLDPVATKAIEYIIGEED